MGMIPVIDLFAGPGGLSEGFASLTRRNGNPAFRVALSIEKDPAAHSTLELRAFFRQFEQGYASDEYYQHLRRLLTREELFASCAREAESARNEAWNAELGAIEERELDRRIRTALSGADSWLVVGGPPCQAYSIVGRARRGGIDAADPRVHLYREYLRILAVHRPPVFVLENVKGLLSSELDGVSIFRRMLEDLSAPGQACGLSSRSGRSQTKYVIQPLIRPSGTLFQGFSCDPGDYVVRSESFGVPQARHRVILLGIRSDLGLSGRTSLTAVAPVPSRGVLAGLPAVRSGLSKEGDSQTAWKEALLAARDSVWFRGLSRGGNSTVASAIEGHLNSLRLPKADRGAEFVGRPAPCRYAHDWYGDPRIGGVCNHSTRGHIRSDLHRYLFAATFAEVHGRSPKLNEFPAFLLPQHANVNGTLRDADFADRFRVQLRNRPSTTVTSHIAKDGHYYIHFDAGQCRSLTVREAARLQTFPDNYLFCGNRTQQYQQVGNAVPPLLARQIAQVVFGILDG